jgi:hypothetical protein
LRGQSCIDRRHREAFQIVIAFGRLASLVGYMTGAGQIGHPEQDQRGVLDMFLTTGKASQFLPFLRVLHRHHAPQVQVGGGGRRLRHRHQSGDQGFGQRVRAKRADGAVVQQSGNRFVPQNLSGCSFAIAQGQCVGGLGGDRVVQCHNAYSLRLAALRLGFGGGLSLCQ